MEVEGLNARWGGEGMGGGGRGGQQVSDEMT